MRKPAGKRSVCHCVNIRRASNRVTELYNEYLAPGNLSVNQFSLMAHIERLECCSITALAEDVDLERTTLVRTLHPLIERGLVADRAEPGRRSHQLELTEDGRRLMQLCWPLWDEAQAEVERQLGPGGVETLEGLLERLV